MKLRVLIICSLIIAPSMSVATNDISGFFGVKLGEIYKGKYEKIIRGGESEPMTQLKIKAPNSYPITDFTHFNVILQTRSKKVSSINAKTIVNDMPECLKYKDKVYKFMVKKFGIPPQKPENQYYTFRSSDNNRMAEVRCMYPAVPGKPSLELTIIDHVLIKEIEREH